MISRILAVSALVLALSFGAKARAQDSEAPTTTVDEIVVTARRTDAPIWEVTRGDSTLVLVGAIEGVPRDMVWRTEALEAAAERSQRILFPQEGRASFADLGRIIWRARTIAMLPGQTTVADYVSADWLARLEAVKAGDDGWRRQGLMFLADDLLKEHAGLRSGGVSGAGAARAVVRRAARKAKVPIRSIGVVRGDDLVEMLITAPPTTHLSCLQASIRAAEDGAGAAMARAEAWRRRQVVEVMAMPLEQALAQCWPWGDPALSVQLRDQWSAALDEALEQPGVTLAVVPLRVLAETDGVLDQMQVALLDVSGPPWKAGQAPPL
ncbi:TraB/GumN family protein [Brevundimonas sp.]|uniref:TraB/GumN family protein n=1 Tax=Brevundimonas sp. TaxID=1871086 RepID=UPI00289846B5|nr:TraB/GumN family protein [Brevundimonas sp.]